jgi:hypothetical protein
VTTVRKTSIVASLALVVGLLGTAQASPLSHEHRQNNPGPGGMTSDNVEWVRNLLISQDGVGGRLIGDYFYANDQNKIMIFDVSETPENPELVGQVLMPQEWLLSREDLDGNNNLIVVPNHVPQPAYGTASGALYVIDVEDKRNPTILSTLPGGDSHTSSCVLNCRWVYNSNGRIIDLRDPANPKMTDFRWGEGKPAQSGHDVEEIAPGIVLTATQPIMLLDARRDPRRPRLLALGSNDDGRFIHSARWPRRGRDRFALFGGETNFRARCSDTVGAFMTWDASRWRRTRTFTMIDEWRPQNGTISDGNPPANTFGGCSAHWFEASPKFRNGGIVAGAFFENGTRFLEVNRRGKIEEVDFYMPWVGSTGATYWITDEILYTLDYNRGIDIIRYTGKHR